MRVLFLFRWAGAVAFRWASHFQHSHSAFQHFDSLLRGWVWAGASLLVVQDLFVHSANDELFPVRGAHAGVLGNNADRHQGDQSGNGFHSAGWVS